MSDDPFEDFELEPRIVERGRQAGLRISDQASRVIAAHARAVLENNVALKLTTITEPEEFLERHIGESLEGAALIGEGASGRYLDLGSGTGYPLVPVAAVHDGLDPVCVEAAQGKARFLQRILTNELGRGSVIPRQVQRPDDIGDSTPLRLLTTRAMGNWERILPRFSTAMEPGGIALLWAGEAVKEIATRDSWRRWSFAMRHALPGRQRSWIWCFRRES